MTLSKLCRWALPSLLLCFVSLHALSQNAPKGNHAPIRQIIVPLEDRFTPFAITVRVGQPVVWVNNDADDHTVVSDDAFNTAGHRGTDFLLPSNGGQFTLVSKQSGVFPFSCRFHTRPDPNSHTKL